MVDELEKHFDFKFDDRYHCLYCSYDTQLPNKAINHLHKKHDKEISKAVARAKKPARSTAKTQVSKPETKKK